MFEDLAFIQKYLAVKEKKLVLVGLLGVPQIIHPAGNQDIGVVQIIELIIREVLYVVAVLVRLTGIALKVVLENGF